MTSIKIICRRYSPGEAWTNRMLCYAKGLVESGYRVELCFLISDRFRNDFIFPIKDVIINNLWERDSWLCQKIRGLSYLININKVKNLVNQDDIVLMFDAGGLYVNQVRRSKKNCHIICEITEHPDIIFYRYRPHNCAVKHVLNKLKKTDCIFTITHSIKDYLIKNGIEKDRIRVVSIFVDFSRFSQLEKTSHNNSIAYCGTLGFKKDGVDLLIKAFAIFIKNHPDYHLSLYGRGENDSTITKLKDLCVELSIQDHVVFHGYTKYEEMPQALVNASILALSRPRNVQNTYGFPTKLGEYLATGNPVVVTSVGEIPLFIKDGINGFLSEPGNVYSFAEKLSQVADNYEEAKKVGQLGYEAALKFFSYSFVSSVFNELIKTWSDR